MMNLFGPTTFTAIIVSCSLFHFKHTSAYVIQKSFYTRNSMLKSMNENIPYFASIDEDKTNANVHKTDNTKKTVVIAGATGYIGRAVVRESIKRGYNTIALVRNPNTISPDTTQNYFPGATVIECNVEDPNKLSNLFVNDKNINVDTVISCLASASGLRKEAYAIDYQATLNCMNACINDWNGRQFILLSAFCVRKPLLQLQQAKLKFEAQLTSQNNLTYSIVRPTAFFKSVSGQLESLQQQNPYVLFGSGDGVTKCNPISEEDLAIYMMNCINDKTMHNRIMNIGGPDIPLTNKMLGEMMFKAIDKEPKFVYAPTWIFDTMISSLSFLLSLCNKVQPNNIKLLTKIDDIIETTKIGKYYAVEDMLTTEPNEKFGSITMQDHYNKIASKGQDPFTPVRATALISRIIENGPLVFASLLPTYLMLNYPQLVQKFVTAPAVAIEDISNHDFSLLLAKFF